ncbi:metal-dependent transcriptional regulator [Demequina lignilytica]|uniref:Manganese transport regulator n=1 Tax=Demequina lignilytica TaxID=3051663 RepID=A0AAW7M7N5_9MICO|nr:MULTISPECIES: metal-dependent transcriptional regulator [unclassified Demequina]MDN4478413.1 metal-dependent transcriptional regulator [Demequina sp. SYSU T00039-1]MDN4482427.1 metal-dependent transcriptional regulator [Demequina sp. SYSU T0a273]MDN4487080.1 metal-dependent transcriptional regulator [Demequina sp. SYSU T00039]MDN4489791.1 metal-dependent transcriptional regulator [Demequina sp. SYSU T00068]
MPIDPQTLSATAQDYVKIVWGATEWSDAPVTTKMLAERLGVSAPTVSENVRKLAAAGLLDHEPYGAITLTADGERCALDMVRRHRLIETFLVTQLGYGWDEVHDEAEVLEHACSTRMIDALDRMLGHPTRDPHGDPIPTRSGRIEVLDGTGLDAADAGQWRVTRLSDADPAVLRDLSALGLVPDATIRVLGRTSEGVQVAVDGEAETATIPPATAVAVWLIR